MLFLVKNWFLYLKKVKLEILLVLLLQGEVNEDEKEEFKIRSFADMLDGLSDIGVPYWTKPGLFASKRSVSEFSKLAIEKWPVIQAYAIEGVGK